MTFDYSSLPYFRPKMVENSVKEVTIENKNILDYIKKNVCETELHVKEIRLRAGEYHEGCDPFFINEGIARFFLTFDDFEIKVSFSPSGLKHAMIEKYHYFNENLESYLKDRGVLSVALFNPDVGKLEEFKLKGFVLRPPLIRWFAPLKPLEKFFSTLPHKGGKRFRSHLRKSKEYRIETGLLTKERFNEWYPIYESAIVSRPGGFPVFIQKYFSTMKPNKWIYFIGYYFEDKLVGGALVNAWGSFSDIGKEPRKFVTTQMQAYYPEHIKNGLSYKSYIYTHEIATDLGDFIIGHGMDMNFYGADLMTGLLGKKSAFGMYPFPEGDLELFKILRKDKLPSNESYFFGINEDCYFAKEYFKKKKSINWNTRNLKKLFRDDEFDSKKSFVLYQIGDEKGITTPQGINVLKY